MGSDKNDHHSGEQADSTAVKAELESRLNQLLAKALSDRPSAIGDRLNSPFVITVIGGLLIGAFGSYIQFKIAGAQSAEAARSQLASRKEKLAYNFADTFPTTLSLAERFKERELWLTKTPYDSKDRFNDGRNFEDTRIQYESLLDRYLQQKPTASLCNEIVSSFPSQDCFQLAGALNTQFESLLKATNLDQLNQAFQGANSNYQALTKTVFDQLNNPSPSK